MCVYFLFYIYYIHHPCSFSSLSLTFLNSSLFQSLLHFIHYFRYSLSLYSISGYIRCLDIILCHFYLFIHLFYFSFSFLISLKRNSSYRTCLSFLIFIYFFTYLFFLFTVPTNLLVRCCVTYQTIYPSSS